VLRYRDDADVGERYRGVGDIAWILAWPDAAASATAVLATAQRMLLDRGAKRVLAWDAGLPLPLSAGVPDSWPHIAAVLTSSGYRPTPGHDVILYSGYAATVKPAIELPVQGITLRRVVGGTGTRFAAEWSGISVGWCECVTSLTSGGALPSLGGWAEVTQLHVVVEWRRRGIGTWLIRHMAAWLRLGGLDRIIVTVPTYDETAGAGRFFDRMGWSALARIRRGWTRSPVG
jgi:GNAT superfamily N-acetyltransferase